MARRVFAPFVSASILLSLAAVAGAAEHATDAKLDAVLRQRAHRPAGTSQVIVRTRDGRPAMLRLRALGAEPGRHLAALGQVARVPDTALHALAALPEVASVSVDRRVRGAVELTWGSAPHPGSVACALRLAQGAPSLPRGGGPCAPRRSLAGAPCAPGPLCGPLQRGQSSYFEPHNGPTEPTQAATGARWVAERLGYDGSGIGIALIDSGVTAWHDDLDPERVVHFADFINFRPALYDDYGHGTHVAGVIAGSGSSSGGARRGLAPGASLIVLKAIDGAGGGYISNVIAAIDYAIAHRDTYNIRIINLSVSAGVYESYTQDPLTLAARRAVDAGIVVVAAAGNLGAGPAGRPQYGGIAAPGNAPWVLTVGASDHNGTPDREDDEVAAFSSRGPSAIDRTSKPDLVAPGVAIQSLAEPSSVLFAAHPAARIWGTEESISEPYLSLSGTSMAAPAVAATIALMLDANPSLTPNAVKAILQFTAEAYEGYDQFTQGAGFLNARGAVELARHFRTATAPASLPDSGDPVRWSRQLIWGADRITGGILDPQANAWDTDVVWGARRTSSGEPIAWGTLCAPEETGCSEPWTTASRARGGDAQELLFEADESACDDPGCFEEAWFRRSTPGGAHRFVTAGSVIAPHARPASHNARPVTPRDALPLAPEGSR